jgi:hypothetical protein
MIVDQASVILYFIIMAIAGIAAIIILDKYEK